jgi:glycosyltransferase involved in cell wall biosynthesis
MFPMDRAAVIAPGVDAEYLAASPRESREPRVAFTGSWIPRKGVDLLVRVMNQVLRERLHVRLDLYGTGHPPGAILGSFAADVRERITVFGRLANAQIADRLSSAAVFLFPSQYEGFGMALAEAMACGCAPVTTPTGFGGELTDGREAIICAFDDEARVRTGVLALLDDAELRARIAEAARSRVEGLSWDAQIARLDTTYRSWLQGSAACDRSNSSA